MIKQILVVSSAVLVLLALLVYAKDILKKKTKPRVVSWLNWGILALIAASASLSDHQYPAAILSYGFAALCITIAALAWHHGDKKFSHLDIVCQIGVIASLMLWAIFNSPSIAIVAVIAIDFIALIPTLHHSWVRPSEETWQQFMLSGTAAILTVFAADNFKITSVANPLYIFMADYLTAAIIIFRSR